ncbi:YycC family protein [Cohnella lupini]|uniref:YycC-like protein n=1 Tax=Cohnella lupini TaxID=1294267 RepID=A0A3D9IW62_9BACL|nr:YycC family protein [Cohnella lupini]RED65837.1 YycC-like protein [Cohnella lupini]
MRRMPLSADTAVKLAEYMKVPLEHLMHMPQHILLQKLGEMAKAQTEEPIKESSAESQEKKE